MTALPAGKIIGGIDRAASGAGIPFDHFPIPFFIANLFYAVLRRPQLDPVRGQLLELLQIAAGIVRALAAKIHAFSCRAFCHRAFGFAEKAPFCGPASVALHFLKGALKALGHQGELCRLFEGPDVHVARAAKQPTHGGKFFVNVFGHHPLRSV
jgi:hypothetical protein